MIWFGAGLGVGLGVGFCIGYVVGGIVDFLDGIGDYGDGVC